MRLYHLRYSGCLSGSTSTSNYHQSCSISWQALSTQLPLYRSSDLFSFSGVVCTEQQDAFSSHLLQLSEPLDVPAAVFLSTIIFTLFQHRFMLVQSLLPPSFYYVNLIIETILHKLEADNYYTQNDPGEKTGKITFKEKRRKIKFSVFDTRNR